MGQSTTADLIYDDLREYALQDMNTFGIDAALDAAIERVDREMTEQGPDEENLMAALEKIEKAQKKYWPNLRFRFLDNPDEETRTRHLNEMRERLAYSKARRKAAIRANAEAAKQYLIFHKISGELFDKEKLAAQNKIVDPKRWINQLIMLEGIHGDAETCRRNNEAVVMLTAMAEEAITPEEYIEKRRAQLIRDNMDEKEADERARAESEKPAKFLYDIFISLMESGVQYINRAEKVAKTILDGSAAQAPGGYEEAYRSLLLRSHYRLMFNANDALNNLNSFGLGMTSEEVTREKRKWEEISTRANAYVFLTGQVANPYYAVLDPVELLDQGISNMTALPGQDPTHSYFFIYTIENHQSGLKRVVAAREQELLRRFDMQEDVGEEPSHEIYCKADPTIKTVLHRGRTIIIVRDEFSFKNGEIKIKLKSDVPGRLVDAELLGDVVALREACAALPRPWGESGTALAGVRDALAAMAGMTLGDTAENDRIKALDDKLKALALAAAAFSAAADRKHLGEAYRTFSEKVNRFVTKTTTNLDYVRQHKATVSEVEAVEKDEKQRIQNGMVIPPEDADLTPFQRNQKPIHEEEKRLRRQKEEADARAKAEKEKKELQDSLAEGSRVAEALDAAEEKLGGVEIDENWAKAEADAARNRAAKVEGAASTDPIDAMISAYIDANADMGRAMFGERDRLLAGRHIYDLDREEDPGVFEANDSAHTYVNEVFAADTVRELLAISDKHGQDPERFRNILRKGGLAELIGMVKQSPHFKTSMQTTGIRTAEMLNNYLGRRATPAKRIAYAIMKDVEITQKQKAENPQAQQQNPQVQQQNPQVQLQNPQAQN